ncbi:MAG: type I DNA topoisomerase [Candidatus Daviesbacteria bacterium]|nr:type I DNA topoisomerase [Candidatus Daviesbacteria bacterium]
MQNLVIVESPTKAATLSRFLGSQYIVEASMGHIRDLPKSDVGVDIENNFEPKYIIPKDKTKRVNELKKLAASAKTLWLATDPDREGEAIAWHISELIGSRNASPSIRRVVFHEITPEAVNEAFLHPREIDLKLVDAQQARRILDRLVGYKLSPLLWKKVKSGLSAGRVQSVALRLIVERDKEINAFKAIEYWSIEAQLEVPSSSQSFTSTLVSLNGKKLEVRNQAEAETHVGNLQKAVFKVLKVEKKDVRRYPPPPFTTSTLQQTASSRLGFSAKKTMMIAQNLYERGMITYMRTDSVNLSGAAVSAAREYILEEFGKNYLPKNARIFKTKSKSAQEAHEAIRPSSVKVTPDSLKKDSLTRDHLRLYELIWKRMMGGQMSEAVLDQTSVDIEALNYLFRTVGSVIKFDGWLKLYGNAPIIEDEINSEKEEKKEEQLLPKLEENEVLDLLKLLPDQHFTEPPPRFNEASLIKRLEELGIGRPSTYAPIISTIQDRFYVEKKERKFFATELGIAVTTFLVTHFPDVFSYQFTADMEDRLDEIAEGKRPWRSTIAEFYEPLGKKIAITEESAGKVEIEREISDKKCPDCGSNLVVKFGRFGKFLACLKFPECKHTEGFEERVDAICPDCGGDIVMRRTKKGKPFYGCKKWPECKFASWTKPK